MVALSFAPCLLLALELPSRMVPPLIHHVCKTNGKKYNDYIMIHSTLFFDALVAHVRFDGLSSLQLVEEIGRVCKFAEGECILAVPKLSSLSLFGH